MVGVRRSGPALEEIHPVDTGAEVAPEHLLAGHEQHVAVAGRIDLVADALAHSRGPRRAAYVVVARVAGDLGFGAVVGLPRLAAIPVESGGAVALRKLEIRALAGVAGPNDRGEDGERTVERGGIDADADVLRDVGEALVVDSRRDDAGPGVVGDAVTGVVAVGAGRAVAGDAREHELLVSFPQHLRAESEPLQRARTHRLHDDVRIRHEVAEDFLGLIRAQVEHDAALAPVDVQVHERDAFDDRPGHLADVVPGGRLDLDHVGTEVDERARDRRGPEHGDLDDAQPGQWRFPAHGQNLTGRQISWGRQHRSR